MQLLLVFLCCALVFKLNGRPRLRESPEEEKTVGAFCPSSLHLKGKKEEEEEEEYNVAP